MDIIQIGSNRGGDDLTRIIFENKERLGKVILVEPISTHHDQLRKCYEGIRVIIETLAITDDPAITEMSIYYSSKDAPNYEVASFSKEHIIKHAYSETDILEEKVSAMTINQLMGKHNLGSVDILFIDAEGLDERIIRSIQFSEYKIKEIVYENIHIVSNEELIRFLSRKNFKVIRNWGENGWSNRAVEEGVTPEFLLYKLKIEAKCFMTQSRKNSKEFLKDMLIRLKLFKYYKSIQHFVINKQK